MNFKTPSPRMAGFITLVLLTLFAFSYIVPVLNVSWLRQDAKFDAALQQTLLVLLVGAVAYYIGTTRASEDKNAVIATQANTAAAVVAASNPIASPLATATPAGTPEDPVSVIETTKG